MSCANTDYEKDGIPSEFITPEIRLKTEAVTRIEAKIGRGHFFVGSNNRTGVSTNSVHNAVIVAGDNGLAVEDLLVNINFANVSSGGVTVSLVAYVESSNGNSWSYTPLAPTPIGRSVNTNFINTFPLSTVDIDVIVNGLTGVSDYPLHKVDYFLDTGGNRNLLSVNKSEFLSGNRKILVGAGERALIQTVVTGTATGTIDINSVFFTSELEN